jgi:hypothetical protein
MLLALYFTMGLLLAGVGFTFDTWQFWCFFGLFWAVSHTARDAGRYESVKIIFDVLRGMNIDIDAVVEKLKEKAE